MDESAEIVSFLIARMAHGFLVRDADGTVRQANTHLVHMAGTAIVGRNARDFLPGLRDEAGDYETELIGTDGAPRILSVATARLGSGGHTYMDLLTEIKTDRALRDRLVAEVQKMSKLAQTDSLTGLANRVEFDEELHRVLQESPDAPFGVAIIDLDDFKEINDRYGHSSGDAALIEFASRLRHSVRNSDLVARMGGDEFAALFAGARREVAAQLVERLIEKLSFSLEIGNEIVPIHASVGWAHSDDGEDRIFEAADQRMYLEKRRKKRNDRT